MFAVVCGCVRLHVSVRAAFVCFFVYFSMCVCMCLYVSRVCVCLFLPVCVHLGVSVFCACVCLLTFVLFARVGIGVYFDCLFTWVSMYYVYV